jgi:hypothetical protein
MAAKHRGRGAATHTIDGELRDTYALVSCQRNEVLTINECRTRTISISEGVLMAKISRVAVIAGLSMLGSSNGTISVDGVLVQGVECPGVQLSDGRTFSLVGVDHQAIRMALGRSVRVTGTVVRTSFCMQGLTLRVSTLDFAANESKD